MYVYPVHCILHNVYLQTSICYLFLEDSRKTLITTYKLIVKPWMSLVFSQLTHTESAEHQIFLILEKYCIPCGKKAHERFFFKSRKKERGRVFQGEEQKKIKQIQGWPFKVKCYKQPKLALTLIIMLREITSQHDTSPSKGSHSFPLNNSESGESSDIAHDKEKTTVLLKYKYFDPHLQRAHKSPKTAEHISHSTTQHRSRQSQISGEVTVAFTIILQKVHLFARASEQSRNNTRA